MAASTRTAATTRVVVAAAERSIRAFSLPAVIAGRAATSVGLHTTAMVYGLVVVVLGAAALAAQRFRRA